MSFGADNFASERHVPEMLRNVVECRGMSSRHVCEKSNMSAAWRRHRCRHVRRHRHVFHNLNSFTLRLCQGQLKLLPGSSAMMVLPWNNTRPTPFQNLPKTSAAPPYQLLPLRPLLRPPPNLIAKSALLANSLR